MRKAQDAFRDSIDEADMTTPDARTKSVVETRDFLELLARADAVSISGPIETVATGLLRHYPMDVDLEVSALALSGVWAHPESQSEKPCE